MNSNELRSIKAIQISLDSINHPDSFRVAREIFEHTKGDQDRISSIISSLKLHKPWEYIRGYVDFLGLQITVNEHTLIPRVETEELVRRIIEHTKQNKGAIDTIVDIGTGSGAIISSLAHNLKSQSNLNFIGSDYSESALDVARRNANQLNLTNSIKFIQSDILENLDVSTSTVIVANLPYIPTPEYLSLEKSVKEYEPRLALDGGEEGLDLIERLIVETSKREETPQAIFLEIDPSQSEGIHKLFSQYLSNYDVESIKDYRNVIRFIQAVKRF